MADIQSISQGNYILATQQEVSHDNSLSGNGTVDSPLGVVPGYNETVLWSGDAQTGTLIMTEAPSSFNTFKIYYGMDTNSIRVNEYKGDCTIIGLNTFRPEEMPTFKFSWEKININNNSATVDNSSISRYYITTGGQVTCSVATVQAAHIYHIVGINRKA